MLPVITRRGSPARLGQFALALAVIAHALRPRRAEGPPRSHGRCRPAPGKDL